MRRGVYAGSFDPIHHGHLDIIERAAEMVDTLYVAVAHNAEKPSGLFTPDERVELIRNSKPSMRSEKIVACAFTGLTVEFCHDCEARMLFRGLRASVDFDAEFEMHGINYTLDPMLRTVFLMAKPEHLYISSRRIKEVASLGGNVAPWVPSNVEEALQEKFGKRIAG
jgi:pantetheine-phosphate adenylyltransferase